MPRPARRLATEVVRFLAGCLKTPNQDLNASAISALTELRLERIRIARRRRGRIIPAQTQETKNW